MSPTGRTAASLTRTRRHEIPNMFTTLCRAAAQKRLAAVTALIALATGSINHAASAAPVVRPLAAAQIHALGPKSTPALSALAYTTIDDGSDPTFNRLLGIDDDGVISGYFGRGSAGHPNTGYTVAPPYNTFESRHPAELDPNPTDRHHARRNDRRVSGHRRTPESLSMRTTASFVS